MGDSNDRGRITEGGQLRRIIMYYEVVVEKTHSPSSRSVTEASLVSAEAIVDPCSLV